MIAMTKSRSGHPFLDPTGRVGSGEVIFNPALAGVSSPLPHGWGAFFAPCLTPERKDVERRERRRSKALSEGILKHA